MNVFRSFEEAAKSDNLRRLAVGFFDGVHRGHKLVFEAAHAPGDEWSVLTFWPHPQAVLSPAQPPPLITGLEHKLRLFEQAGASSTVLVDFDPAFAARTATDFLDLLAYHFPRLERISCGPNFHFGKNRQGDSTQLRDWSAARGIRADIPPLLMEPDGPPVSSSRIRSLLRDGDLAAARQALGRPYSLWGKVVPGAQLGRTLGFPTANVETGDHLLLPSGVYAGYTKLDDGSLHASALNFGQRPTVAQAGGELTVETHLLDYQGDLYGKNLEITPVEFIRPEVRFDSLAVLQEQIARDILQVRKSPAARRS